MVPRGNNAPYRRLALVGRDVKPVSWRLHATKHNKEIQRVTRVCRFRWSSSSLKMSESDSNSDCSYDTDDSDYNFITGNVNIDDIEVEDDENFSLGVEQVEPDPDNYKPYEDEPIAAAEWLSAYKKRQETQVEFERKLQDRYDGKQLVNSW